MCVDGRNRCPECISEQGCIGIGLSERCALLLHDQGVASGEVGESTHEDRQAQCTEGERGDEPGPKAESTRALGPDGHGEGLTGRA